MNTRSPYPDTEVPEIFQPRFVPDRADERVAAVPLMGPAAARQAGGPGRTEHAPAIDTASL